MTFGEEDLNGFVRSQRASAGRLDAAGAGRTEAARGCLCGAAAGDRRNDCGIDGWRRLTGQSPQETAEPIDKGCTADARAGEPARHGPGAGGAPVLPRGWGRLTPTPVAWTARSQGG